jgi:hypothetical protein
LESKLKIELKKFGEILMSRPAGREAADVIRAYFRPTVPAEKVEVDFNGAKVIGPSWLDEVLDALQTLYPGRVTLLPSSNPSVIETIKILKNT